MTPETQGRQGNARDAHRLKPSRRFQKRRDELYRRISEHLCDGGPADGLGEHRKVQSGQFLDLPGRLGKRQSRQRTPMVAPQMYEPPRSIMQDLPGYPKRWSR